MLPQAAMIFPKPVSSTANPATSAQKRRRRIPHAMAKHTAANTTPATGLKAIKRRNRNPNARTSHQPHRMAAFEEASDGMA
jgi:hypothetical protein